LISIDIFQKWVKTSDLGIKQRTARQIVQNNVLNQTKQNKSEEGPAEGVEYRKSKETNTNRMGATGKIGMTNS